MKAMAGYVCTGSPDARTRCSAYCATCGYSRRDIDGSHKNEEYYVPQRDSNPTYVPSYRKPFISDNDLRSGKVVLY